MTTCSSLPKRIAGKSIHPSKSRQPHGRQEGNSIGWVKDRQQWLGRVRGKDGRQRWVKAADLRPGNGSQP
jgi:hypothetical protein